MVRVKSRFAKGLSVLLAGMLMWIMLPGRLLDVKAETIAPVLSPLNGDITVDSGKITQAGKTYYGYDLTIAGGTSGKCSVRVLSGSYNISMAGVYINDSNYGSCAFSISSGASVQMILKDASNTLISGGSHAGVEVPAGASLFITGSHADCTDSIAATGGGPSTFSIFPDKLGGAGIGTDAISGQSGRICISECKVSASGKLGASGIGGGAMSNCGDVTVLSGTVNTYGGIAGYGIGSGTRENVGSLTVYGGTVTAVGGDNTANGREESIVVGSVCVSGGSVSADNGTKANRVNIKNGWFYGGLSCAVTDDSGKTKHCVTVSGLPKNEETTWSDNGGQSYSNFTNSSGQLQVWLTEETHQSIFGCNGLWYCTDVTPSMNMDLTAAEMKVLNLQNGDIALSDGCVQQGGEKYDTDNVVLTGSGSYLVSVNGGTHSIVLDDASISNDTGSAFSVSSGKAYVILSGSNSLTGSASGAGLKAGEDASVFITGLTGSDSLTAYGGKHGAGIGSGENESCGNITVSGGDITASGGDFSAGIGGSSGIGSCNIAINGGYVTANGLGGAADIGDGYGGGGGNITVTSGTIAKLAGGNAIAKAVLGDGTDYSGTPATVKITGGSVKATINGAGPTNGNVNVYLTSFSIPDGITIVSLDINLEPYGCHDMFRDGNNTFYLYLPSSDNAWVSILAQFNAYTFCYDGYHGPVDTSGASTLKMNQKGFVLSENNVQTVYGNIFTLSASGGQTDGKITYAVTGGTDIVSVGVNSGEVSTLKAGASQITATKDGNSYYYPITAVAHITVGKANQTGFAFPIDNITKTCGETFMVAASGIGSGKVTYRTSDESVATVGAETGLVTAKKTGTVTITAIKAADDQYNETTATTIINIKKGSASVKTIPAASNDISVVGKLSSVALTGGEGSVAGSFSWTNPDMVVSEDGEYEVTFIPADSTDYSSCICKVKVKVTPVITNSGTGIQYDLSDAGLPDGVTSVSVHSSALSDTDSGNSRYSVVSNLIDGSTSTASTSAIKIYSLSLLDQNGNAITGFTGKITVKIPISDGMSGDLHVYWYNDADGTLTDMNARQENGYLVFETTHFSYYAVAGPSTNTSLNSGTSASNGTSDTGSIPNPDTGSGTNPIIPAILFGGTLSGLVIIQKVKKYRRNKS